tara:strand:+ start:829 stop:1047 length:219 start_codon:yes stop_codon:yes gene_type:complete
MFIKSRLMGIPVSLVQGTVVLLPTYIVAYLTDKMVYTIPMLAAMSFVAARIGKAHEDERRKTDEDGGQHNEG